VIFDDVAEERRDSLSLAAAVFEHDGRDRDDMGGVRDVGALARLAAMDANGIL